MAFWQKQKENPIDRAVGDLEKQIATLQRQLRTAETSGKPQSPVAAKAESVTRLVKEALTPPSKRSPRPAGRSPRDLFDTTAEPLKDLEAEPIAFAQQPAPDLFAATKRIIVRRSRKRSSASTSAPAACKASSDRCASNSDGIGIAF
jgi:hypothetical protein